MPILRDVGDNCCGWPARSLDAKSVIKLVLFKSLLYIPMLRQQCCRKLLQEWRVFRVFSKNCREKISVQIATNVPPGLVIAHAFKMFVAKPLWVPLWPCWRLHKLSASTKVLTNSL